MKPLLLALIALCALCAPLNAEVWNGTSEVKFKGTSTLHDFEGTVRAVPLKVTVKGAKGSRLISATSDVDVKSMSTDEKDRDKNMWEMFKSTSFQFIKITVPETPEATVRPAGGKPGTMPINLNIAGTTGTVTGTVKNLRESATAAAFDLSFDVSLKAFNLKPPSTLAGLVKVGDTVAVTVRVTLARQKS
jgi:hypothetical protein